jgi:hypothetical protein
MAEFTPPNPPRQRRIEDATTQQCLFFVLICIYFTFILLFLRPGQQEVVTFLSFWATKETGFRPKDLKYGLKAGAYREGV